MALEAVEEGAVEVPVSQTKEATELAVSRMEEATEVVVSRMVGARGHWSVVSAERQTCPDGHRERCCRRSWSLLRLR